MVVFVLLEGVVKQLSLDGGMLQQATLFGPFFPWKRHCLLEEPLLKAIELQRCSMPMEVNNQSGSVA